MILINTMRLKRREPDISCGLSGVKPSVQPHININCNSLQKEECVFLSCVNVALCHLLCSPVVAEQTCCLMLYVPVSWLSGSPVGWKILSSRSSWDALQRSKPWTAGPDRVVLWTRIPECWRPKTPTKPPTAMQLRQKITVQEGPQGVCGLGWKAKPQL